MRPFLLVAVLGLASCGAPNRDPADVVLVHGKVVTLAPDRALAEALAVRGDRIVAVGRSEDILALAGPKTETIELGGRTARSLKSCA